MKEMILSITTHVSAGTATVTGSPVVCAKLYAIEYRPGTIATGATVTVTCESASSKPLLIKATAGTANTWFYPRDLVHAVADGAALTGTAGGDRAMPILNGAPTVVIASGGNSKVGSLHIYYEE